MKRLLVVLALATPAHADTLSAYYDPMRQLAIVEHSWFQPFGAWHAYGFTETYRLPAEGYPAESNVIFGKAYLMREVAPKVRVGLEVEYGRNNAGMWTRGMPFEPGQWRVIPKLGVSIEVR